MRRLAECRAGNEGEFVIRDIVLGAGVVESRTREEGKAVQRVGASAWAENRKEHIKDILGTVPNVLVV
jgi:hypothetical protein